VQTGGSEVWARPLADGSVAVVLFSHSVSLPVTISTTFELVSNLSCAENYSCGLWSSKLYLYFAITGI